MATEKSVIFGGTSVNRTHNFKLKIIRRMHFSEILHALFFRNIPSEAEPTVALTSWHKMYHWNYEIYGVSQYLQALLEILRSLDWQFICCTKVEITADMKFCAITHLSNLLSVLLVKNLIRDAYYTVPADTYAE
jgi:hypothetical protein